MSFRTFNEKYYIEALERPGSGTPDDRVDFRLYTTAPFLYEIYRGKSFAGDMSKSAPLRLCSHKTL